MYDVKSWLKPHMEQLHNHSHPHIFRFRKASDGCCYMQYKQWRHSEWEPPSHHGIKILKVHCMQSYKILFNAHSVCADVLPPGFVGTNVVVICNHLMCGIWCVTCVKAYFL